jgi:hypothetical protein
MVQRVPGRCNIKFFSSSLVQGVPSHPAPAQVVPAHPSGAQAVANLALRREEFEIDGENSHLSVNWMVQDFPGRSTPAHRGIPQH